MAEERNDMALIEAYLGGELVAEEKQGFEERLEKEPALMQDFQRQRENLLLFQVVERQAQKDVLRELYHQHKTPVRRINSWIYVAAAAAVALVALFFWNQNRNRQLLPQQLAQAYYDPYPLSSDRSANPEGGQNALEASALYRTGKYAEALPKLRLWQQQEAEKWELPLFIGICLYETGNYDEALAEFERVPETLGEQARWYQALSYLQLVQKEKAREILTDIDQAVVHFKQSEAREILSKM
jgi:tetratricopeptide (TPR) repeat protein